VHIAVVAALKAKGSIIFHNSFYEYGFFFIEELVKMKAKLIMADPYRIISFGPTDFKAARIIAPNIIQATMALFIAALGAEGTTILDDAEDSLLRRYPNLIEKYTKLGAKISKL
jgi:UDP-N-acetylglucosamine 1-carboxyvinyltransferase